MIRQFASWNMKEGRPPGARVIDTAADEVEQLADEWDADVLTLHEAKRYNAAVTRRMRKAGYKVVRFTRDASARDSMILARGCKVWGRRLHRLERRGWERKPGRPGLHDPRSAVSAIVGGVRVIAVHMPPPAARNQPLRVAAWDNSLHTLSRLGRRWNRWGRPWVMTGDWNRRADHPDIREFARDLGATVYGDGIDYVIACGVKVDGQRRVSFGGSDHDPVLFSINKEKP